MSLYFLEHSHIQDVYNLTLESTWIGIKRLNIQYLLASCELILIIGSLIQNYVYIKNRKDIDEQPAKEVKGCGCVAWATSCVRYAHCQETILPFSIFGKLSCNAQKPKHFCVNFVLNSVNLSMNSCSFSFV